MKIVDHNGQLNKSSPDSGYPGENGDLSNGFYENLPFHGMKQQPQQPHKQVSLDPFRISAYTLMSVTSWSFSLDGS